VKFSAAGDIGVGNIKLAQTANVDKVISSLSQCSVPELSRNRDVVPARQAT
jgi:hypothetical protein